MPGRSRTHWPTIKDTARQLGISEHVAANWVYKGSSALERAVVTDLETRVVDPVGKRTVRTIDPTDAKTFFRKRRTRVPARKKNSGRLRYPEVEEYYGWNYQLCWKWKTQGIPFLPGEKLVPLRGTVSFRNGTRGIMEKEVDEFTTTYLNRIKQAEKAAEEPYRDAEGTWLSSYAQQKKYGYRCTHWREHPSPYLKDEKGRKRKIRHKEVTRRPPGWFEAITETVDHEDDVRTIVAARKVPLGYRGYEKEAPYTNERGPWYTGRYAESHFRVSAKTLADLRTTPSPFLGGRTIEFLPPDTDRPYSNRKAFLYLGSDIEEYIAHRDEWMRSPGTGGRFAKLATHQGQVDPTTDRVHPEESSSSRRPAPSPKRPGRPKGAKGAKAKVRREHIVKTYNDRLKQTGIAPSVRELAIECSCSRETVRIALREAGIDATE